ncbi:tetratricopeptide (TPR) repeat protein [Kitasatospora sp. GAS204A]|uniref:ATP-binding protein n=1 Tax=unclassified Kitasatospora TaxID=2633591 RepID=UPI0024750B7C|nr:AAA family ATPase [Kitasatospora sp. GAS204B]MDH6120313.1 tetratricopeptide (TPR) repeat protein [Kitasatospora sp. GAS204B]
MTERESERGAGEASSVPRLYEREIALSAARAAIDTLRRDFAAGGVNLGSLLLYSGKAGLGKTTMLQQVRALARNQGLAVLSGRAGEQRVNEPFYLLRQLLLPELLRLRPEEQQEVLGPWREIAGPALALLLPGGEAADPQSVRTGIDYVVTQLAIRRAPLVMLVDDLQWADHESLSWLEAFAQRCPELPVLLAIAWRSSEMPEQAQSFRALVAGNAHRHLEFQGLQPEPVKKLVHEAFPDTAEDSFCRQVWAVTDGNPFLVNALLAKIRESGIEPVHENVPLLHDLAAEAQGMDRDYWLTKLSVNTFNFAQAAAMLGTQIAIPVATRIAGMAPSGAADAIAELRRHQVLNGPADGPLEFVHPLLATSLYKSIRLGMRTAMHGKAAQELENAGRPLVESSRHLLETHPEGDPEVVVKLRQASREHLAVGAPDAAVRCLDRALAEPPEDEDRPEVIYELGCATLLTDPVSTVNQLRLALDTTPPLRSDLRVDATFRLSEVLAHSGRLVEAAEVTLAEAERTAPGSGRTRLQVAHFIWAAFQREEVDGPERSARLAALCAELPGDDLSARAARALRAWDLTLQGGDCAEVLALVDSALLPDGRLPAGLEWTGTMWGLELPGIIGLTYVYTDRLDRAEKLFEEAIRTFEVAGWGGGHLGFAYFLMGLVRFRRGALAEAENFLRQALRIARQLGPGLPLQWDAVGVLADTLLARGRTDDAWKLAAEFSFAPPYHPTAMVLPDAATLYGKLLLAQQERPAAAEVFTEVGERLVERGWHNTIWAPWLGNLALAVLPEDPERARRLADEGLARARSSGVASAIGTALRMKAAVAEGQNAVDLLAEAVRELGRSPVGYEQACALVELGAALRKSGRLAEATEQLHQGMELAVECNADGLMARAREELRASGLRPSRLRSTGRDALSQVEWRVAQLTVEGLSPAEIAERLKMPPGLVDRRLAAVHRKTGSTQAGLAAALGLTNKSPDTP